MMRVPAVVSAVLCVIALILSFLCLFAGSSQGFMEDYAIITLNTSQIGQQVVGEVTQKLCSLKKREAIGTPTERLSGLTTPPPTLVVRDGNGYFSSLESVAKSKASSVQSAVHALESDATHLCDEIGNDVGNKFEEVLQVIGLNDWYSAHVMDFCQGYYIPGPVVNGTCENCVKPGTIHKNVTHCSNTTVNNHFDPKNTIAEQLKKHTNGEIDLTNLHWPQEISDGLNALKDAQKAVFVLYCIAIVSICLALAFASLGIFRTGRLSALANMMADSLAFLMILGASAIISVIAVKATHLINEYGRDIGIRADRGDKFLALTWAITALVLISWVVWCYEFFASWKRQREMKGAKYG